MKYFNVTSVLKITKKPKWIDGFRKKYDKPYAFHLTFKTITKLKDEDVSRLKKEVAELAKQFNPQTLKFDGLDLNFKSVFGGSIMIMAKPNKEIARMQKIISKNLSAFGEHYLAHYQKFEKNFKPHLTIARRLSKEQMTKAKKELQKDLYCTAKIDSLQLTIVAKTEFSHYNDPRNKTFYKLK